MILIAGGNLDAQLKNINEQIEKILSKLDSSDKEIDEKIEKGIRQHEKLYHHVFNKEES